MFSFLSHKIIRDSKISPLDFTKEHVLFFTNEFLLLSTFDFIIIFRVFSSIMSSRTAASLVNKSSILLGILLAFSTFAFTLGQRDLELEEWALAQQQQQLQHPFAQWNMVKILFVTFSV